MRTITMIRHVAVSPEWKVLCYGWLDARLSATGQQENEAIAQGLRTQPITHLYSSDLSRAYSLATSIAVVAKQSIIVDDRLRERHFGTWEGQTWDEIHRTTGDAMMGLIDAPETFAPPEGETTAALQARVLDWYHQLPSTGNIVCTTHGGPIAVLLGTLTNKPIRQWLDLIPAPGQMVILPEN